MSRKYGNQPTPPSDKAIFNPGNFRNTGDHTRSAAAATMFIGWSVAVTSNGASGAVTVIVDGDQVRVAKVGAPAGDAAAVGQSGQAGK